MDEKIDSDMDALQKWLERHMVGYAAESMQGSFSMPNAPLKDSGVPVHLNCLLVRINHNLRSGATYHWPTQTSSLTRTFFLGLIVQGFMQAEC